MANNESSVITFAADGMNDAAHPAFLQVTSCARMTNCQIKNQLPTTRPGVRFFKLGDDAKPFKYGNIQGAMYYNPSLGQSQTVFGQDQDSLIVSVAGRKLHLTIGQDNILSVSDETNGDGAVPDVLLAYLFQAENYAICQDGISDTWIWDGESDAVLSDGYRLDEPTLSRLANQAGPGAYIHGRIVQVIDKSKIIVGDLIHTTGYNSSGDILKTTEQIYYATGAYFSPPSALGEIRAMAILPIHDTTHGHSDLIIHCRRGIYSLKLDIYPRDSWPTQAISRHLLLDTGAEGPYAIILNDGDQIFRSRHGVQSIRSTAAQMAEIGNPNQTLSEPVSSWIKKDPLDMLRYCSMERWASQNRILISTGLWIDGAYRGSSGFVCLNLNPAGSLEPSKRSWEGLWTLPSGYDKPVQAVSGLFPTGERLFILTTSKDECSGEYENNICEVDADLPYDVLPDGSKSEISCQVITGAFPLNAISKQKHFHGGKVTFTNIIGKLKWGVWCRNDMSSNWVLWKDGTFEGTSVEETVLQSPKPARFTANLRDTPIECNEGQFLQCLVRWRGYCSMESLELGYEEISQEDLSLDPKKMVEVEVLGYDDYEYSKLTNRWDS